MTSIKVFMSIIQSLAKKGISELKAFSNRIREKMGKKESHTIEDYEEESYKEFYKTFSES